MTLVNTPLTTTAALSDVTSKFSPEEFALIARDEEADALEERRAELRAEANRLSKANWAAARLDKIDQARRAAADQSLRSVEQARPSSAPRKARLTRPSAGLGASGHRPPRGHRCRHGLPNAKRSSSAESNSAATSLRP